MKKAKSIKVQFTDFWPNFTYQDFYLYKSLSSFCEVEISEQPDILFYSVYSNEHLKYNCTKVLFTGENTRPNFSECDFAFSFDYTSDKRNYRLPLFAIYDDVNKLIKSEKIGNEVLKKKKKFCCFIVSNPCNSIRNDFFKLISAKKHVDSAGILHNNIGGPVENKRDFIKDYKFVIAFENDSYPGYVTEKIFEPFLENCVPIYWGTDSVSKDFNTKSFVNCHDFNSFDEVIDYVLELNDDDERYLNYLNQPAFKNNKVPQNLTEENITERIREIVEIHANRTILRRMKYYFRPSIFFYRRILRKLFDRISVLNLNNS